VSESQQLQAPAHWILYSTEHPPPECRHARTSKDWAYVGLEVAACGLPTVGLPLFGDSYLDAAPDCSSGVGASEPPEVEALGPLRFSGLLGLDGSCLCPPCTVEDMKIVEAEWHACGLDLS
jgi:hypothetical protein